MGTTTRSVRIRIVNASGRALRCAMQGAALTPLLAELAAGATATLEARSTSADLGGTLRFSGDGNWSAAIDYCASSDKKKTKAGVRAETGALSTTQKEDVGKNSVDLAVTFYAARHVVASGGMAVDLGDPPATAAAAPWAYANFVDRMFDKKLRNDKPITAITKGIAAGTEPDGGPRVHVADMTGGQIDTLADLLTQDWIAGTARAAAPDAAILGFLRDFVGGIDDTVLWVPEIAYVTGGSRAKFRLSGYSRCAFGKPGEWSRATVSRFLRLLLGGAHIVSISSREDLGRAGLPYRAQWDLYDRFLRSGLVHRDDKFNSHYSTVFNPTGEYYLRIKGESTPDRVTVREGREEWSGVLDALLFGVTISWGDNKPDDTNCFLQLEGWPAHGVGGERHGGDFDAHKATVWNISTFGATPYSEKRATTVFLAPGAWVPKVTKVTRMAPYVGAYAQKGGKDPQRWLETDLVEIDEARAAPLPPDCVDH